MASRATTAKKCTEKRDARAKLIFCQSKPIVFFLLFAVAVAKTPYCCHPKILLPWKRDVTLISIKYKIRRRTIINSKGRARKRRVKLQKVKDKLKECTEKCDIDPNSGNLEELVQSVFKQIMINCTITLHKGQSFALGQPGMKWVKKTTNIF